jgi:hypothetical protein
MFILKYTDKKWKIYLKNSVEFEVYVCCYYDEKLAQIKLNELNKVLIEIIKYHLHDQE